MLEAAIAILCLVIGMGIGWWIRSQSAAGKDPGDPEKIARLEAHLHPAGYSSFVSRTNWRNLQNKFEE